MDCDIEQMIAHRMFAAHGIVEGKCRHGNRPVPAQRNIADKPGGDKEMTDTGKAVNIAITQYEEGIVVLE